MTLVGQETPPQQSRAARRAVACILNGAAGSSECAAAINRITTLFEARGCDLSMIVAKKGADITGLAKGAVGKGASVVVAAGGDGTINAVASALVEQDVVLGVLPLGTLNHFAKDLAIPTGLEAAVATVLDGTVTLVDVGEVNGKFFLNNSSLGLYPAIVQEREGIQKKGLAKWLAFAVATFGALRRFQPVYVELQAEGKPKVEEETPFLFIGNNQYAVSGLRIGERGRLDAGSLWIYRAPRAGRAALARLAIHALLGRPEAGELKAFAARQVHINMARRQILVATDGEVTPMNGPLRYRILPKALRVIVPSLEER